MHCSAIDNIVFHELRKQRELGVIIGNMSRIKIKLAVETGRDILYIID